MLIPAAQFCVVCASFRQKTSKLRRRDVCITGLKSFFEILIQIRPRRIDYTPSEIVWEDEINLRKLSAQNFYGLCRGLPQVLYLPRQEIS
jgi:hypothetical protein